MKLITDGQGVDLILDPVLGSFFQENLECLGMDARWVIYGSMGGIKVKEANLKLVDDEPLKQRGTSTEDVYEAGPNKILWNL